VWKNQYFELDEFTFPCHHKILEVELASLEDDVILPSFIEIESEVTNNEEYSNYEISKI